MTGQDYELRSKDRNRKTGIVWWAFFVALAAIPPLNKYVTEPLAGRLLDAPDSMASWIMGGAVGGAFFGGVIWLVGRTSGKHSSTGTQT